MAGQISTKLEVYEGGGALPDSIKGAVLAIGNFDGLHRGHRVLLDTVVERARAGGRKAAVMLFEPHPREYFHPQKPVFRLTTFEQKLALLESIGIDVVIQLPFDARLAEMPAETFVVDVLLGELAVSHIVVGYDFFFGKGRGGSPALLESIAKSRGVGVTVVEPVAEGGEVFSSSAVRGKIAEGDVKGAAEDLGYFWRISGTVVGGAKRGTGQPSAFLAIEGMMDRIGRRLGIDPAEVRRRNTVRPEEFPYVNVVGVRYDTGSYLPSLERGLEMIGYDAFRAAQPKDRLVNGKYRGIGICNYTEVSGTGAPGWRVRGFAKMPGFDSSRVVVEPDGKITVYVSQADAGQGHYTTFAQIAADRLGVACEDVTVVEGDTSKTPYGTGTFASRGSVVGGGTVIRCSEKVGVKIRRIAGYMLDADPERLVLKDGRVADPEDAGRSLSLREVAETAYSMNNLGLPQGEEHGLEATDYYDPPMVTMANGTHVVQVAVDPEDGRVEIERYAVVHDCGRVINPRIVEGQVHGATVQGIGEALMEEIVYDADGQHLNANLLDYLMPTAMDVPELELDHIETPSIDTVGGIKGAAEGGLTGAVPAIANAVGDALSGLGVNITRVPLRPSSVFEQIRRACTEKEGRA